MERLKEAGIEDGSTASFLLGHQDALSELGKWEDRPFSPVVDQDSFYGFMPVSWGRARGT